jgi:uncharacterized membrane protein YgdD (TMEM256/DUF423 family)
MCEHAAMNHRLPLLAAALFGATGVAAGAFGAHALRPFLIERGMLDAWETGVHYQLLHAVALLGLAGWLRGERGTASVSRAAWAVRCWCLGMVFFSGSLYLLASGGPRWLGPVTPLGGLSLIAGWLCVAAAAWVS